MAALAQPVPNLTSHGHAPVPQTLARAMSCDSMVRLEEGIITRKLVGHQTAPMHEGGRAMKMGQGV